MDHSTHTPLPPEELNASNLEGANVYGPQDHDIGNVSHFHGTGPNAQVVVDVGGFLGIGAKPVALDVSSLTFMRDPNGNVHATTMMTKDQLKELPEHHH
ncbi:PRC-barrel domain-containing protein [Pseudosulfitobacter koreensis]|uniref:PRC-barrel domain-containing protein n=1 Tax=Pseudosulfitobacter koreensis TaxID=2968472 RepID=A0ABT1Z0M0_9RHOB|nr:PRC-barrel domain-containing protein [Pseudosulfitobacter koreense]MCR8826685.1 PRC-barrel domain-containing protein [Pseudosulfitobacter koreense]